MIFSIAQTPLIIDSGLIMRLLRQSRGASNDASNMALITLPGYLVALIYEVLYRTLFARKEIWPVIVSGAAIATCALGLQILSICALHWALVGIALANCLALVAGAVVVGIIFLAHQFVHEMRLLRPTLEALGGWKGIGSSYITSVVLQIALRFINEFALIIGGVIGPVELAATNVLRRYTLIFTILGMAYSNPSIASIGAAIGARSSGSLRVYTAATFMFFGLFLTIATAVNIIARNPFAYLTANDSLVAEMVANVTILVAIYDLLKLLLSYVIYGFFRGSGSMIFPTATTLIVEYLIGIPLGLFLSLHVRLGIAGFYLAMSACFVFEIVLNIFYIFCYLWPDIISRINQPEIETPSTSAIEGDMELQTKQNEDNNQQENSPILPSEEKTSEKSSNFVIRYFVTGFYISDNICSFGKNFAIIK